VDDPGPRRSLADDPDFLASLSELDRGLRDEHPAPAPKRQAPAGPATPPRSAAPPPPQRTVAPPAAAPAPPQPSRPVSAAPFPASPGPPPPGGARKQRALIDLFPPSPKELERPPGPLRGTSTGPTLPSARPAPLIPPPPPEPLTYETFYGLREKPFSLSWDQRFLYHGASHDRAVQALLDAVHRGDAAMIVTGDAGVGKTTLGRALIDQLDRRTPVSFIADPSASSEQLLDAIPQQTPAVLIIDDAHDLPIEVLDRLRVLGGTAGVSRGLQVVLIGEPSLRDILNRPDLKAFAQRVAVRCKLEPLADDEIAGYVVHRLAVAGPDARVEFDEGAIRRAFELSSGNPRLVNLMCDRALALGRDASASVIDDRLIDMAAQQFDIAVVETEPRRALRVVAAALVLALLTLAGAAAAAVVFRDRVTRVILQWESIPQAPVGPMRRLPIPLAPPRELPPNQG
jgi:type II secretory pathway predicted ATPase ExeA